MKNIIILILLVFLVLLVKLNCSNLKYREMSISEKINLQKVSDSLKNKLNHVIKTQEAVILNNEKEISKYADSIFALKNKDKKNYKSTISYNRTYINTNIKDTLYIPFINDTTNVILTSLEKDITEEYMSNSIRVPKTFELDSNYFKIKGNVSKEGINIISLSIPDTISGRFIEKKNGFLKSKSIEYQVFNTNPYISINNINSAMYINKKDKKLKYFLMGIGAGIVTSILLK